MKIKTSKCPYCGRELGLCETLQIKDNQTYGCPECKNILSVVLDKKINLLIIIYVALYLAIISIFSLVLSSYFLGAMLLILVSIVFYVLVPLFIELKIDHTSRRN